MKSLNIILISQLVLYSLQIAFRVLEPISFNMKDYRQSANIYNNYERLGDSVIFKDHLIITPKLENSYGLIFTKQVRTRFIKEITSKHITINARFEIAPEKKFGSAFAIWFFKDSIESLYDSRRNTSYLGFKVKAN